MNTNTANAVNTIITVNAASTGNTNFGRTPSTAAGMRVASRRVTWYDLSCLGLLATSFVAITVGFLG